MGDILGARTPDLFTRVTDHLIAAHEARLKERTRRLNWELFDRAVGAATWGAIEELNRVARDKKLTARGADPRGTPEHSGVSGEALRRSADALAENQG